MNRKYEEYNAKHGPLFPKLKHKDRLNFEDASLVTNKWTTKICKKDVEALPIILEKDELDMQDDDSSTSEEEIPAIEESDSVEELVASVVKNVLASELTTSDVIVEPSVSNNTSQSELNDEFSCIFTNTVSSGHSVREHEFETMYSNDSFAQGNAQNVETVSLQSVESSSDEEMDDYFRFKVFLPKRKVFCHLQTTEARTELVSAERPSDSSLPLSGIPKEEEKTDSLKLDTDITSSECEIVLGTMEADFSDSLRPDQYLHTSSLRRVARPLNLRYASEELDDDSVKMLCHATSVMNFGIAEGETTSPNAPIALIDSDESKDLVEVSEVPELACSLVHIEEYQKLKVKPSCQIPSGSSEPSTSQQKIAEPQEDSGNVTIHKRCAVLEKKKVKRKFGKGKMSPKTWWKSMNFNLRWNKRRISDEDTEDDSSD